MDLSHLNDTQKEAVTYKTSPLMVIAGAGSGKTLVLTYRVAYLIKKGIKPSNLFITTFTNKASEEMIERLKLLVGEKKANRLVIGTFHSLCFKMYKDLLDYTNEVWDYIKILKGGARFMTMVSIVNKYKVSSDFHKLAIKDIKYLLNRISTYKNNGCTVDQLFNSLSDKDKDILENNSPSDKKFEKYSIIITEYLVYKDYEDYLKEKGMIDFDDMLLKTYVILSDKKNRPILENIRSKISHILVDEAQDLNIIQHKLINILSGEKKGLTIVLDDWQSIYRFRNVHVESVFEFKDKFNAHVIKLEQNYRSTKNIVNTSNKLIKYNTVQIDKTLFTNNEEGEKVNFNIFPDADSEAKFILDEINNLTNDGVKLNDIAIIYRTNAQSRPIVDELILNDINHIVYSNESFYERSEVKDIISYIKILKDPFEAEMYDFKKIINKPKRFLGAKFINEVEKVQIEKDCDSYWEALNKLECADLQNYQKKSGREFVDSINYFHTYVKNNNLTLSQIVDLILKDIDYQSWLIKDNDNIENEPDNDICMNIESLCAGVKRFKTVDEFLCYVDMLKFKETDIESDYLHLMTVHKSKGMEFKIVFVIGMSTGLMPHRLAENEEEERRIAYVAVTRSKKLLYVSSIKGKYNNTKVDISKFVNELGLTKIKPKTKNKNVILKKKSLGQQMDAINKILG